MNNTSSPTGAYIPDEIFHNCFYSSLWDLFSKGAVRENEVDADTQKFNNNTFSIYVFYNSKIQNRASFYLKLLKKAHIWTL